MSDDLPHSELTEALRRAMISRCCDDKEIALQKQNRVFFQISGAGHEALCLGLARWLKAGYDWFFPYYRDRSLMLGLGVSPTTLLLQAVGSGDDPGSGGRQMPCHWGYPDLHVVSQTSATGSQCLPAVGCAEAGRYLRAHPGVTERHPGVAAESDEITYLSLGEGATSQGEFWESLNTACLMRLPVLYVIADNGWAISVPRSEQSPAPVIDMVAGFRGLEATRLDGTDYEEVRRTGRVAVEYLRDGGGPVLLHADVTRPYSHSAADTQSKYRTAPDLAEEQRRDPLLRLSELAVARGALDSDGVERLFAEARDLVDEAARTALDHPSPDPASVTRHLLGAASLPTTGRDTIDEPPPACDHDEGDPSTMADAINRCLHEQMALDERIRVFGEDVADAPAEHLSEVAGKGGVFGTTLGLQSTFGGDRCLNTPLAEANIVGRAVGQALRGLRPCPEVQFFDYIWTATQQIRTEASTMRWRSNGGFSVPMVLRVPIGGYLTGGAIWHSQCGESFFAHIPGLLVAMPSRAVDAVGLLRTAFRCEDPVLFLEHKHLYRQPYARDPYPAEDWALPFGRCSIRREGSDLTVVTWGATVEKSIRAADLVEERLGISSEVIDLRTIIPWDRDVVAERAAATGRVLVVHEDCQTAGFGAEVAAYLADTCFWDLDAPVRRVAALDTNVAYAPVLEEVILPQVADIADAMVALGAE